MFLFHTTNRKSAKEIIRSGYLRPRLGILSFSSNPHFGSSVDIFGTTFVYDEDIIFDRYQGEEIDQGSIDFIPGEDETFTRVPVAVSDAIEILPSRAAIRKYAFGMKFHFKDVRDRTTEATPSRVFRKV
ncbi:hypothetical protein LCGC14_0381910 [marine sediment metagenome]|uniref:Uncharacterized protein n=1 Tax=marine sediment metagenome TaxID=412755 RepID=A0A0F9T849_9ZZZZ